MQDFIFVLINHFEKTFKKKDLHYLIYSRLKNEKKKIILNYDIKLNNKCQNCKDFRPWIILRNNGEGIFILKKIIEKYKPWITYGILSNFNFDKEIKVIDYEYDFVLILINSLKSRKILFDLIEKNRKIISDMDIRLKNSCFNCMELYPWILIKKDKKNLKFINELKSIFSPFITINLFKTLYEHNIPEKIRSLYSWKRKDERDFSNLKIKF